jgi:hypothetical protein
MPAWGTALIALASSIFGGAVVAWWRMRFEREEHLRELMISAADDYSQALLAALLKLADALRRVEALTDAELVDPTGRASSQVLDFFDEACERISGVEAHLPRVLLLFRADSEAGKDAFQNVRWLNIVVGWRYRGEPLLEWARAQGPQAGYLELHAAQSPRAVFQWARQELGEGRVRTFTEKASPALRTPSALLRRKPVDMFERDKETPAPA